MPWNPDRYHQFKNERAAPFYDLLALVEVRAGLTVIDLGCGSGVLLDYLVQTKQVSAIGVDLEFNKITACVRRGLTAYQGDMTAFMRAIGFIIGGLSLSR